MMKATVICVLLFSLLLSICATNASAVTVLDDFLNPVFCTTTTLYGDEDCVSDVGNFERIVSINAYGAAPGHQYVEISNGSAVFGGTTGFISASIIYRSNNSNYFSLYEGGFSFWVETVKSPNVGHSLNVNVVTRTQGGTHPSAILKLSSPRDPYSERFLVVLNEHTEWDTTSSKIDFSQVDYVSIGFNGGAVPSRVVLSSAPIPLPASIGFLVLGLFSLFIAPAWRLVGRPWLRPSRRKNAQMNTRTAPDKEAGRFAQG